MSELRLKASYKAARVRWHCSLSCSRYTSLVIPLYIEN